MFSNKIKDIYVDGLLYPLIVLNTDNSPAIDEEVDMVLLAPTLKANITVNFTIAKFYIITHDWLHHKR